MSGRRNRARDLWIADQVAKAGHDIRIAEKQAAEEWDNKRLIPEVYARYRARARAEGRPTG